MTAGDPKWLEIARKELGTKEIPGSRSNPRVIQYYVGAVGKAQQDSVPWCSAFVGWALVKASEKSSGSLMARSYSKYGVSCSPLRPGAIAVWPRGNNKISGHVNFVESIQGNTLVCIGGNQGDAVTRAKYDKRKAVAFRWPSK